MLHNDEKRQKVLSTLIKKRRKNTDDDAAFFDSLDKAERMLLTNIHFGLCKVSEEDKKLLAMK